MELRGICKHCLGCNRLETSFIGTHRCTNFIQAEPNWEEKYREELKKIERRRVFNRNEKLF